MTAQNSIQILAHKARNLSDTNDKVTVVRLEDIVPDKNQPRKTFDNIQNLANSIRSTGQIYPLIVSSLPNGKYSLIDGERRYRALLLNKSNEVRVLVRDCFDETSLSAAQLILNNERDQISHVDTAKHIYAAILAHNITQAKAAELFNINVSTISKYISIAKFLDGFNRKTSKKRDAVLFDQITDNLIEGFSTIYQAILSLQEPFDTANKNPITRADFQKTQKDKKKKSNPIPFQYGAAPVDQSNDDVPVDQSNGDVPVAQSNGAAPVDQSNDDVPGAQYLIPNVHPVVLTKGQMVSIDGKNYTVIENSLKHHELKLLD